MRRSDWIVGLLFSLVWVILPQALAEPAGSSGDSRDLLFLGDDALVFFRIHIRVERASYREAWDLTTENLFVNLDLNEDEIIDNDEAKRLPNANFAGRNPYYSPQMQKKTPVADLDNSGSVDRSELATYLRASGAGEFTVQSLPDATGRSLKMDEALFSRLDQDRDGRLDESEFEFSRILQKLDADDDETISLPELHPILLSPYASSMRQPETGSEQLYDLGRLESLEKLAGLIFEKYSSSGETKLSSGQVDLDPTVFAEYDKNEDGALDQDELVRLMLEPSPTVELIGWMGENEKGARVERYLGTDDPDPSNAAQAAVAGAITSFFRNISGKRNQPSEVTRFHLELGNDRVDLMVASNDPRMPAGNNQRIYEQQFDNADQDNNKYLDENEARRGFFNRTFAQMDQNGDGQLYQEEVKAFVQEQEKTARSRTLVSVTDRGRNLFSSFDRDGNGRITRRELLQAREYINQWDRNEDGMVEFSEIPRHWRFSLSQGQSNPFGIIYGVQPNQMMTASQTTFLAPNWFRKMDRNRDSDISLREFLGRREDFDEMDANGDGLISAEESRAISTEKP